MVASVVKIPRDTIKFLVENSLFLIFGALCGLIWANVDNPGYSHLAHEMHFWVNDIAMAFFFLLAGKEIREAMLPGGSLADRKTAALPLLATIGGMLGPALIYLVGAYSLNPELSRGWAIPMATDIAFSYMVAKIIFGKGKDGKQHAAIVFLLLLAIADDAGGLLILAAFYPTGDTSMLLFALLLTGAIGISLFFWKIMRITSFWPYLIVPGVISWFAFYKGGIHPALALVPLAWCIPHAKSDMGIWAVGESSRKDTLNQLEHWWKTPVELILGIFGFVNAGVEFSSVGVGTFLVLAGLLVGKPLGIYLMVRLGQRFGLTLPEGMDNRDVIIVGFAAGIGFTVALFVSVVAFPAGAIQDSLKMGALISFFAVPLTFLVARFLKRGSGKNERKIVVKIAA